MLSTCSTTGSGRLRSHASKGRCSGGNMETTWERLIALPSPPILHVGRLLPAPWAEQAVEGSQGGELVISKEVPLVPPTCIIFWTSEPHTILSCTQMTFDQAPGSHWGATWPQLLRQQPQAGAGRGALALFRPLLFTFLWELILAFSHHSFATWFGWPEFPLKLPSIGYVIFLLRFCLNDEKAQFRSVMWWFRMWVPRTMDFPEGSYDRKRWYMLIKM